LICQEVNPYFPHNVKDKRINGRLSLSQLLNLCFVVLYIYMSGLESIEPIRPLNTMERQRFVGAVRNLLPPLAFFDDGEAARKIAMVEPAAANDLYSSVVHRLDSGTLTLTESEPLQEPDYHEVSAEFVSYSGPEVEPLRLKNTSRYSVFPSADTSTFIEKVRPLDGPEVPPSSEVFAQQFMENVRRFQEEEFPSEFTFSPQRLAVIMPLIAQCHRGNLVATTGH
jgi:hypothetical protein